MSIIRKIRRSQYITPFGVGAVLDLGGESFIAEDISQWKQTGVSIKLPRLQNRLRVKEFKMPKVSEEFWNKNVPKVPFRRFPQWLFCKDCRDLKEWKVSDEDGEIPRCTNPSCRGNKALVPMRFVMACAKGHLADVDWHKWAHSNTNAAIDGNCSVPNRLKFKQRGDVGGGLYSLKIHCEACEANRNLNGITGPNGLNSIGVTCSSSQPWEWVDWNNEEFQSNKCKEIPVVLQKGASNLHFPKTISALDIPLNHIANTPNKLEQKIIECEDFIELMRHRRDAEGLKGNDKYYADRIAESISCTTADVLTLADRMTAEEETLNDGIHEQLELDENEMLDEEWPVLTNPPQDTPMFSTKEEPLKAEDNIFGLNRLIDKLILVPRLREVRVLRGFHRVKPSKDDFIPVGLGKQNDWLPATEVFGEGIFIKFSEEAIASWEKKNKDAISDRIKNITTEYEKRELTFLTSKPSSRFILLHTFAHLLIRQLSFECGYSASSLRERLYSKVSSDSAEAMAGILIYTADSDSEGALGGLVRQGKKDRFISTVMTALERGTWCSGDPVCKELPGQGMMGLNRAACHSCALVSETSCTCHNTFLDRMLVIGHNDKYGSFGFFSEVVSNFLKESAK